jgi:uncharacterized protein Yka (UPF0111/DUF47 family)
MGKAKFVIAFQRTSFQHLVQDLDKIVNVVSEGGNRIDVGNLGDSLLPAYI